MTSVNFTYDEFLQYRNVPRETYTRLSDYVELLKKWQKSINLVSPATLPALWLRHIIDSIQLVEYIEEHDSVIDLGSGAGLPGLVIAIAGERAVTLVESDGRKIVFLKEAARVTKAQVTLLNKRVESIDMKGFSLIVARAFAPLTTLIQLLGATLESRHKLLLLKGKNYLSEIDQALAAWTFDYTAFPSITDRDGVILSIHNLKRKEST